MSASLKHPKIPINLQRLAARLDLLAEFTEPDKPWTRLAFSDLHLKARQWLRNEMHDLGLTTN
ncbi:Zn-dependent hydrolase, partial [Mesorhizobium sp. M7D.F.Ca.US.004.03.1.1]